MANDPAANPAVLKNEITTPVTPPVTTPVAAPVAEKAVEVALASPKVENAAPAAPAKAILSQPVAPVKQPVAARPAPQKLREKKVAKAVRASKAAKAVKVPKAKAKVAPVKVARTAMKAPVMRALKPAIEIAAEPFVELPQIFEAQMKKLKDIWFFKELDTGDIHIANEEIREVVESSREATIEAIGALNKEMENFFQHSVDEGFAAINQLMSAKSLPEAVEVQSRLAQDALQAFVEHSQKLNAIAKDSAVTAFRPLSDSWTQATAGFKKNMFL